MTLSFKRALTRDLLIALPNRNCLTHLVKQSTCCQKKPDKGLNPDKPEITNYKHHLILKLGQINYKLKYPNLKYDKTPSVWFATGGLVIVICLIFVIWNLLIAHMKLGQNGIVSFSIKLADFQASGGACMKHFKSWSWIYLVPLCIL